MIRNIDVFALRSKAFQYRGGVWTVLFLLVLALARPAAERVVPGLLLVIAGQAFRCWGAGTIMLYRGEQVKAARLATWGPYALVRNPLYVANGILGLGWAWIAGDAATAVFVVTFAVLYGYLIVPHEEKFLLAQFGDKYRQYCRRVGAFFPQSIDWEKLKGPFDRSILLKSEIHTLWVTVAGTILILSRFWW